ncbi:30S ribosomal protein S7 [Treponema endosymbiont of Eucomonympha sp.]|uniref:30S ribosomal protein S7 n=1 Tax=Treponema endosymbiont of Eucomonympha sp. TaxID=1580831 RepID=UPI0007513E2E|nr:30S ribosomal protein S7 [Treponema endosymbiont of Eucomonympha sp.]
MGRKNKSIKRTVTPDVKYHSIAVSKFVARMMHDGKKETCTRLIYGALEQLKTKTDKDPLDVFLKALDNVKPMVEVKSRRVGGATYHVPTVIRDMRREALAMRWIIAAARTKSGHGMNECLSIELLDAFNNTGTAYKKKEDMHRMAEANKAFAHYRW